MHGSDCFFQLTLQEVTVMSGTVVAPRIIAKDVIYSDTKCFEVLAVEDNVGIHCNSERLMYNHGFENVLMKKNVTVDHGTSLGIACKFLVYLSFLTFERESPK